MPHLYKGGVMGITKTKRHLKNDILKCLKKYHNGHENRQYKELVYHEMLDTYNFTLTYYGFKRLLEELLLEGHVGMRNEWLWFVKLVDEDGEETRYMLENVRG